MLVCCAHDGKEVALHEIVRGLELSFLGTTFKLDPFVIDFEGFQLNIGMDWLGRYGVSL